MPATRPAWTFIQTVDLRLCAIEYLRMVERGTCPREYFSQTWSYWVEAHGIPDPSDWDNVNNYSDYIDEYRRRVFRTIRWHALAGRDSPANSQARVDRIRRIQRALAIDLQDLQENLEPGTSFTLEDALRRSTLPSHATRHR